VEKTIKKTLTTFVRDGLPTAVLDAREAGAYLAVAESERQES
jgi:hypothetical protein